MFSIVIPTIGRYTLERTLRSIRLTGDDEVIVVSDGKQPIARAICQVLRPQMSYRLRFFKGPKTADWGNSQRNFGMEKTRQPWLMFLDDDDVYVPDAFVHIQAAIKDEKPHIFRMLNRTWDKEVRWFQRRLNVGNVGTPMFCLPNKPDFLGRWAEKRGYDGDNVFIKDTIKKWPKGKKSIVWCEDIIVIVRPEL